MPADTDDTLYVALIGDIRESREIADRRDAQEEFERIVDGLDEGLPADSIASQFTVTTGDEFQGLLTDAGDAVRAAIRASDRFHPKPLRFGIGRGGLQTAVNRDRAIGMDGPCFHRAREAIDDARDAGAWIRVDGWPGDLQPHVNAMFDLVQCVREGWTDRQAQYAHALQQEDTQIAVADRFGKSKSTVSETLSAGHVHAVRRAEDSLATVLREFVPEVDRP